MEPDASTRVKAIGQFLGKPLESYACPSNALVLKAQHRLQDVFTKVPLPCIFSHLWLATSAFHHREGLHSPILKDNACLISQNGDSVFQHESTVGM